MIKIGTYKLIQILITLGIILHMVSVFSDYKKDECTMIIEDNTHMALGKLILAVDAHLSNIGVQSSKTDEYENYTSAAAAALKIYPVSNGMRQFWAMIASITMIAALISNVIALFLIFRIQEETLKKEA